MRLALSASSVNGKSYVELGPSDNVAWDQPRVAVELIGPQAVSIGPDIFNTWLLDTGANTILTFKSAVDDMNASPPPYTTQGQFNEIGIGGFKLYDISSAYRFDFAGNSGERNTLDNARIISDPTRDLSIFGPFGIVGMPAMTERVTTFSFSHWSSLTDFDLYMHTNFGNTLPAYSGPRFSISVDNRVSFDPEPSVVSGPYIPAWSDLPFLTGQLAHNGLMSQGNMLFDTGAQVSILSSKMAFELGLDSNNDGLLDSKDAYFAREETVSGIGGAVSVPVFLIDEFHVPTNEGPDLVWTDLQWLILDIIPGIDGIFGFDNMTSGWIESFGVPGSAGYIMQSHLDFRNWEATGLGKIYFDLNPEVAAVVDPNGPGAVVTESGGSTTVSETGFFDTYQVALSQAPTAVVRVNLIPAASSQVTAVDAANLSNTFLTFTPNNWNIPQTVRVAAVNDSTQEGFSRSYVKHASTSTDIRYQAVGMPRVIVNVVDNDFPGMLVIPTDGATIVAEGGASDTYQIVLTYPPTQNVTISFENVQNQISAVAAVGGANSVVFTPANWNVPQTVVVSAIDDRLAEGTHKTFVSHRIDSPDTSETGYQAAFALQELVQILDNDSGDTVPPRVVDVIVGSSNWTPAFIDAVDGGAVGSGNGRGMSLPGPGQLTNLSQSNINKIYVKFSENVGASLNTSRIALVGTNRANYMPLASLAYGVDGSDVATITLSSPIANDALMLSIFDTLTDAAGNRLDGEWTNGGSLTSGNGTGNGQFNFRINVLPGDVDNSGGVNSADMLMTYTNNGTVVAGMPSAKFDVNGNGGVNTTDLLLVYGMNGTVLPNAPAIVSGSSLRSSTGDGSTGGTKGTVASVWSPNFPWKIESSPDSPRDSLLNRLAAAQERRNSHAETNSPGLALTDTEFTSLDYTEVFSDLANGTSVLDAYATENQVDFQANSIIVELEPLSNLRFGLVLRGATLTVSESPTSQVTDRGLASTDEQPVLGENDSAAASDATEAEYTYGDGELLGPSGEYLRAVDSSLESILDRDDLIEDLLRT